MRVEKKFYDEIRKVMPTPCTDIIVECKGKVLLLLRKNAPAKGLWFFPGGSIQKGESPLESAIRELKEETGIESSSLEYVGVRSVLFQADDIHVLSFVFRLKLNKLPEITLDEESARYKWCSSDGAEINSLIKEVLTKLEAVGNCNSVQRTTKVLWRVL